MTGEERSLLSELAVWEQQLITRLEESRRDTEERIARAEKDAAGLLSAAEQRLAAEIRGICDEGRRKREEERGRILAEAERLVAVLRAELESQIPDFIQEALSLLLPNDQTNGAI